LASVALGQSSNQSLADKSTPARVEFHPIHSVTITDTQYLNGDANGKAVVLGGELSIAQGKGPHPVSTMHASGGGSPPAESDH
jgi:hypothetical protein